jgi:hypothetical protein
MKKYAWIMLLVFCTSPFVVFGQQSQDDGKFKNISGVWSVNGVPDSQVENAGYGTPMHFSWGTSHAELNDIIVDLSPNAEFNILADMFGVQVDRHFVQDNGVVIHWVRPMFSEPDARDGWIKIVTIGQDEISFANVDHSGMPVTSDIVGSPGNEPGVHWKRIDGPGLNGHSVDN